MAVTPKIEKEVLDVYGKWLHSYLNGDVETYNTYFDDSFHFIGSTNNEEFLNRKDTTAFFSSTADQLSGKTELRNEKKIVEKIGELIFITHFFDAWFSTKNEWNFYGRFRFTNALHETKDGWRFVYQHFSTPDSKAEEGDTIGFDQISAENLKLREAIKRRTKELEEKNRELEIESALERIRSQALAMKASTDLLDIVVTMRNEFIKLGHEAHYFWHMMWLPEKYEKAMTSGDGSKIGFVMELPRHIHGDIPLIDKWEKSGKDTLIYAMNIEEAIKYVDKMVSLGDFEQIDPQAPTHDDIRHIGGLTFIMARTTHGEIGYSLPGVVKNPPKEDVDLLVHFAKAFDFAHKRFLDLQKSEQQAQEVQIELALEKVRSKSMSMQNSNDFSMVTTEMFNQLREFGGELFAAGIVFCDKHEGHVEQWHSIPNAGMMSPFIVPIDLDYIHQYRYDQWKNGEELFSIEIPSDFIEKHFQDIFNLPSAQKVLKDLEGKNTPMPEAPPWEIDYGASFKNGYILVSALEPFKEAHILPRFAKVFEQTYTRFLDLKKAEEQAREKAIELALEKVRSRTMAMQHSDELQEASYLLDQQVRELGIQTWGCAFNIYREHDSVEWFGNEQGILPEYTIPREGIFKEYYDYGQQGKKVHVQEFVGEECIAHYEEMSKLPIIGDVLRELKRTNGSFPDYQIDHVIYHKHGYLLFITTEFVKESTHDIFRRFAKVFEQTYTRFLDLQKAEGQAKEAQIELALERVRSRSMAMHKSEELFEAGEILYRELSKLGIKNLTTGYILLDKKAEIGYSYGVNPADGSIRHQPVEMIHTETKVMKDIVSSWRKQEPVLLIELDAKETIKHQTFIAERSTNFPLTAAELLAISPECLKIHAFNFKHGYLLIVGEFILTEEQQHLVTRFAKVFEQTYTRFLDLQKAEAQAREAKIEASLERVRSQSMAMHESEELEKVVKVIFEQMSHLEINADHAGIVVDYEPKKDFHFWIADNQDIPSKITVPYLDLVWDKQFTEAKKKNQDFFTTHLDFEEKNKFYKKLLPHVEGLTKEAEDFYLKCPGLSASTVVEKDIGLYIENFSGVPFSDEDNSILMRFGKVFQQTYTRFLDLQKAEAQVRDAQIEASLERVRSKTMAMHSSQDVGNTMVLLFEELEILGISANRNGIIILDEEEHGEIWTAKPNINNEIELMAWQLDMSLHDLTKQVYKAWKNKNSGHLYPLIGDDLKAYYKTLNKYTDIPVKFNLDTFPEREWCYTFNFNEGFIYLFTDEEIIQEHEQIPGRFASVFGQTYRRYQDLKKAEAQAREAQIETALERVRARSMGMHQSDEIGEVAKVLYEQLTGLGGALWGTGFGFCENKSDVDIFWFVNENGVMPPLKIPHTKDPAHKAMYQGWKDNLKILSIAKEGKDLKDHYKYMLSVPDVQPIFQGMLDNGLQFPTWQKWHAAYFNYGYLLVITTEPYEDEEIFKRFAKVFEQSYTRFLDLQKAEAQAREAKIENALEKVRSRTMAMQHSDELPDAANVLFLEVQKLGIPAWSCGYNILTEDSEAVICIMSSEGEIQSPFKLPLTEHESFLQWYEAIKNGEEFFVHWQEGEELADHYNYMKSLPELKETFEQFENAGLSVPTRQYNHLVRFKEGFLLFITYEEVPEAHEIFVRFGKVFAQTYTRFLDLQKAEAQARESEIQLALERVRASSLAMQSSADLTEVLTVLFSQFNVLGIHPLFAHLTLFDIENNRFSIRMTGRQGQRILAEQYIDVNEVESWKESYIKWQKGQPGEIDCIYYPPEVLEQVLEVLKEINDALPKGSKLYAKDFPNGSYTIQANFEYGYIGFNDDKMATEEQKAIIKRFAKEFSSAYRRFLDIEKAEAQAREAQIEAALERVRSKAMAMRSSSDIGEAITILFKEIEKLEIKFIRCGIIIIYDNMMMDVWSTSTSKTDGLIWVSGQIDMTIHPLLKDIYNGWKSKKSYTEYELSGKDSEKYYNAILGEANYKLPQASVIKGPHFNNSFIFKEGALFTFSKDKLRGEALIILERFAKVFGLTYQRYRELIESEKREKDAKKQSSLDRVRGEIASMRSTEDLNRITPIIWQELTNLGVPFFRCGLFIMNEQHKTIQGFLSDPNGKSLGLMNLDFGTLNLTKNLVKTWRNNEVYSEHWNKEEFITWTKTLIDLGKIKTEKGYQGGEDAPESLHLNFVPFAQGMLYVGNLKPLNEEQIELVRNLSESFSIAYSRYEDFNKLEKAKAQVEIALRNLKETQTQLVHSEKMASLGELTAGIAHEIQNPLNFVNNFSEVSKELLDELKEEIENGNMEDVQEILSDVLQNLEKINHHGKRADGIVKGMLQHSRSSSGEKLPTDINALCDEYLRLSYHGLRAKDKSFNADFKLTAAEDLPKIKIIPQDIGRVLLNLINNAFYAVDERAKKETGFEPMVKVTTRHNKDSIEMSVKDNGPGIPKDIKDKIFQPFFTTKPTGKGTGLGLSMSYDIVKAHGGEIKMETKENIGTTFNISLPLSKTS